MVLHGRPGDDWGALGPRAVPLGRKLHGGEPASRDGPDQVCVGHRPVILHAVRLPALQCRHRHPVPHRGRRRAHPLCRRR